MTELNNLPKGWTIAKARDLGELVRGVNYKKEESSSSPISNYIPILRANNIQSMLNFDNLVFVDEKYVQEKQLIKKGDVVFAMSSGSKNLVGKSAKAISDFQGAFGAFCSVFRSADNLNPDYVAYFFQSPYFRDFIRDIASGTNINNLKRDNILEVDIPLPPLPEQKRILAKLEQLLTDLDKGIEYLQTSKQQLKVYRQAVLKWAFEGKLTNKDLKEGELINDKIGAYIEKIEAGKSIKCEERPPSKSEYGILKVSAVTWGKYDENESKTITDNRFVNERFLVRAGDFIFSRANTLDLIGAVVIAKNVSKNVMLSDKTLRIIFSKQIIPDYALYYLRSKEGRKQIQFYSNGNQESMRNIGQIGIKSISIPIPGNTDLQIQIIQEIESRLSVCDKIEETIESSLQQAEALRLSIIKKAFEGKLVRQDPNDEPAEVLLQRIRALRQSSTKLTSKAQGKQGNGKPEKKEKVKTEKIAFG